MRQSFSLFVIVVLVFFLSACGGRSQNDQMTEAATDSHESLALISPEGSRDELLTNPVASQLPFTQSDSVTYVGGDPVSFVIGGGQQLVGGNKVDTWAFRQNVHKLVDGEPVEVFCLGTGG